MKLRTRLTDTDREDLQERLVELLGQRKQAGDEKRETVKQFNSTIKELDERIEAARSAIDEGFELREIETVEAQEGAHMVTRRIDTDEAVTKRKLTPSERGEDESHDSTPAPEPGPKKRKKKTSKTTSPDPWAALDERVGETEGE